MGDAKQAHPLDHPLYDIIREVSSKQIEFDQLEFGPLFGRHVKVLSVSGVLGATDFEHEATLTLWRGPKDGRGKTEGEWSLWLQTEGFDPDDGVYVDVQLVDPDAKGFGLSSRDVLPSAPEMQHACRVLVELLIAAEPLHQGFVGSARQRSFEQLNEAVQDGFDVASDEDDDQDLMLHVLCEHSGFDSIAFGLRPMDDAEPFTTLALMSTESGPVPLAAWVGPGPGGTLDSEPSFWLEVAGHREPMPAAGEEEDLPAPQSGVLTADQFHRAIRYMRPLHMQAFDLYIGKMEEARLDAITAMSTVARNALEGGTPLSLDDVAGRDGHEHGHCHTGPDWHAAMDEFTAHCKLGFLAGVAVDESLHGNLNIRATTLDPVTGQYVRLQVFWQEAEDASEQVHWLAANQSTHPAHGGDPLYPELLAGFPLDSREHIRHAIDHLHAMVHLATDVVNAKTEEVAEVLQLAGQEGDVPEIVGGHMQAEAIEDALMGLNGVARLYTGSTDRDVRNS